MAGLDRKVSSNGPEDYKDVKPSNPYYFGVSSHPFGAASSSQESARYYMLAPDFFCRLQLRLIEWVCPAPDSEGWAGVGIKNVYSLLLVNK